MQFDAVHEEKLRLTFLSARRRRRQVRVLWGMISKIDFFDASCFGIIINREVLQKGFKGFAVLRRLFQCPTIAHSQIATLHITLNWTLAPLTHPRLVRVSQPLYLRVSRTLQQCQQVNQDLQIARVSNTSSI